MKIRKWIPGWRELGVSCLAIVAALALVEIILRIAGLSWPVTWRNHPDRGLARPPGFEWLQTSEGSATIRVNRHGFRSAEVDVDNPSGALRIAVLGDSYTEALQVSAEQRYTEVAQAELTRRLGRTVEVLNFGMEGYGTAQELITFRTDVQQFHPDVVVLQVFAANDIRNNSKQLQGDPARPYFVLRDGELELDTSFRAHNGAWFRRYGMEIVRISRVAQFAYQARGRLRTLRLLRQAESEPASAGGELIPLNIGLDEEMFRRPSEPEWIEAWRTTEALIGQLQVEVAARGGKLLVVSVPHAVQIHPDPRVRSEFAAAVGVSSLSYADDRLEKLGERLGFPVLTLSSGLGEQAVETGDYLCGFAGTRLGWGHFNVLGHRLAGGLLAASIAEILAAPPP